MNETVTKRTQDTLGKVIKKPPLTQKLLSRPPFRFLHDIFTEVIRTTGFMKGLYGENDLKADNVKDKESKMAFLQKAIDVVMLVSGEPLAAKPGYIVAGHEPEKTNELLQAIAKCCLSKMSSDDAVKRVLAGEKVDTKTKASTSRSRDKENREGGERHLDREKKKIIEHSGSKTQRAPDQPKEQESRRRHGEKEHHRDSDRSKHHRSEQDHHANDRDRDKRADRDQHTKDSERNKRRDRDHHAKDRDRDERRDKDRDRYKEEGRAKERDKEKDRERDREKEKDKKRDRERPRERDSDRNRERDKEKRMDRDKEQEKQIGRHKEDGESNKTEENGNIKARVSEKSPSPEETIKTTKPLPASDGPARIPRPSSAKGQRRRPYTGNQAESDSEGDGDAQLDQQPVPKENGDAAGYSLASDVAFRKIPRPSSARPAPPPVKRQESYTDLAQSERMSSAKPLAPVIMDGKRLSEDEDEQFVIEAVPPSSDAPVMQVEPAYNLNSEDKHGGLVKKILETKKDFESSYKFKQNVVSEAAQKTERDMVTKEMEQLCSSIQMVCSSTMALGNGMNYVQEDVDAMQAELNTWRQKNHEYAQALLEEQRETDRVLDPLQAKLAELELLIKKEQEKIFSSKANILRNEDKIEKMMRMTFSPGS